MRHTHVVSKCPGTGRNLPLFWRSGSVVLRQLAVVLIAINAYGQEVEPAAGGARVIEFTSPRARFWLTHAIEGAARRLRRPECRLVFSDFKDASGNLLETNLIRLAVHPADYVLKSVWFADGSQKSQCKGRIAAFTEPGSRVVFVCGRHFEKKSRGSELQIIHEILHTLGLGENLPSSDEITKQVQRRCGGESPPPADNKLPAQSQPRLAPDSARTTPW